MTHLPQRVVAPDIGFGLLAKAEGLRGIDGRCRWRFAVNQAVQHVEHMGFGRNPILKGKLNSAKDSLFLMVQDKGEDLDHLFVTAKSLKQLGLQLAEGLGHLKEGCAIAQSARFALNNSQIVPPVIDGTP